MPRALSTLTKSLPIGAAKFGVGVKFVGDDAPETGRDGTEVGAVLVALS